MKPDINSIENHVDPADVDPHQLASEDSHCFLYNMAL